MHACLKKQPEHYQSFILLSLFSLCGQVFQVDARLDLLLNLLAPHKALIDLAVSKRVVLVCVAMTPAVLFQVIGHLFGLHAGKLVRAVKMIMLL